MRLVKSFAGWLALILSAIVLFVGVFAAVTIWRLSQEPVSLHRITPISLIILTSRWVKTGCLLVTSFCAGADGPKNLMSVCAMS